MLMNTASPPAVGTSPHWTRPINRQEWEAELRFLQPLGPSYRPWNRMRSVVWAITWVALFEGLIHAGHARTVALSVGAISVITLLALGLRTLCYQDDERRVRFARLQPRETVSEVEIEIERLRQVPDLYREFEALEASDIPLLVGDLDSLRLRLERRPEIMGATWARSPVAIRAWWRRLWAWAAGLAVLLTVAEVLRLFG